MMVSILVISTFFSLLATATLTAVNTGQGLLIEEHSKDDWNSTSVRIILPNALAPGKTVGATEYSVNLFVLFDIYVSVGTASVYAKCSEGSHSQEVLLSSKVFDTINPSTYEFRIKADFTLTNYILSTCENVKVKFTFTNDDIGRPVFNIFREFPVAKQ